ncbi:MAG: TetR/AcrR family transcriptional regulator [Lachnospiraceae bacterium]|nr:TetR/AcrR family transcriptional regulator [Lachnospiraceae bacterium]
MNKSESKYFNTAVRFNKALLSLLEKKSFEYITISEICEKAAVNRSTFYLHYENTGDLLRETTAYVLDNFASYFFVDAESVVFSLLVILHVFLSIYLTLSVALNELLLINLFVLSQILAVQILQIFSRLFQYLCSYILLLLGHCFYMYF